MTPQMPLILSRLNLPADTPPNTSIMAAIQAEYDLIYNVIKAKLPVIGDPAALTGSDKTFFDAAVAILTAAKVYPRRYTDMDGQIAKLTDAEGASVQYAPPEPHVAEKWTEEAKGHLQLIEAVKRLNVVSSTSYSILRVAGRDRTKYPYGLPYGGDGLGYGFNYGAYYGGILAELGIGTGYFYPF